LVNYLVYVGLLLRIIGWRRKKEREEEEEEERRKGRRSDTTTKQKKYFCFLAVCVFWSGLFSLFVELMM